MTIKPPYPFHPMHHAELPPVQVESQEQHDKLAAEGWTKEYQHQPFPSKRYKRTGKDKDGRVTFDVADVATAADADALGKGWATEPPIV